MAARRVPCRLGALHTHPKGGPRLATDRLYQVKVLVADGKPGWIPFTYQLPAPNRDEAIARVRRKVRERSGNLHHVRHVASARLHQPGDRQVH